MNSQVNFSVLANLNLEGEGAREGEGRGEGCQGRLGWGQGRLGERWETNNIFERLCFQKTSFHAAVRVKHHVFLEFWPKALKTPRLFRVLADAFTHAQHNPTAISHGNA